MYSETVAIEKSIKKQTLTAKPSSLDALTNVFNFMFS